MKVLDLFCGLGGWSKAFHDAGHECTGIDIKNIIEIKKTEINRSFIE